MIENWAVTAVEYLINQAPAVVILSVIAWRLEARIGACIEHNEHIIDKLLNGKN